MARNQNELFVQSQLSQQAKQKILAKYAKADEKTVQELIKMGESPARIQEMLDAMATMKLKMQESLKAEYGSKIENTQRADGGRESTTTAQNFTQFLTIQSLKARYGHLVNNSTYDKLLKEILELTKEKIYENRCSFRIPLTHQEYEFSKEEVIEQIKIELKSDWKISDEALKIFLEDFNNGVHSLFQEEEPGKEPAKEPAKQPFKTFSARIVEVGPVDGPRDWHILFTTDWVQEIRVYPNKVTPMKDGLSLVEQVRVANSAQRTSHVAWLGAHHYSHLNTHHWAVNTTYDYIKEVKPWEVMFLWYLAATDESIKTSTVDDRKRSFMRALEESYRGHNRDNNEDIDDCEPESRPVCAIGFKNKMAECFTHACNAYHPDNFYKADFADYFKALCRASFVAVLQDRIDLEDLKQIWLKQYTALSPKDKEKIALIVNAAREHAFQTLEKNQITQKNISSSKIETIRGLSVGDNRAETWEQIVKWVNIYIDAISDMEFPSADEMESAKKFNKQREEQEHATTLELKQKAEASAERIKKNFSLLELLHSINQNLYSDLTSNLGDSRVKFNITSALHMLFLYSEDFIISSPDKKSGITLMVFKPEAHELMGIASKLLQMNALKTYMDEGRTLLTSYFNTPKTAQYQFSTFTRSVLGDARLDLIQSHLDNSETRISTFTRTLLGEDHLALIQSHLNIIEARNKDKLTAIDPEVILKNIQKTEAGLVQENARKLDRYFEQVRLAAQAKEEEERRKKEEAIQAREREAEEKRKQEEEARRREIARQVKEKERLEREEELREREAALLRAEARLEQLRYLESLRKEQEQKRDQEQQQRENGAVAAPSAQLRQQNADIAQDQSSDVAMLNSEDALLKTIALSEASASEASKQAEAKARIDARRLREKREEEENVRLVAEAESKAEAEMKAKAEAEKKAKADVEKKAKVDSMEAKADKAKEGLQLPFELADLNNLNAQFNAFLNRSVQKLDAISNALNRNTQPNVALIREAAPASFPAPAPASFPAPGTIPVTAPAALQPELLIKALTSAKAEQPTLSEDQLKRIISSRKVERMRNPQLFQETVEKTGKMYRFVLNHPDYGTKQYKEQALLEHLKSNKELTAADIDDVLLNNVMKRQLQKEVEKYLDLLEAYPKTDTPLNKLLHLAYKTVDAAFRQKNQAKKKAEEADAELAKHVSQQVEIPGALRVDVAEQARLFERFKPKRV